MDTLLFMAPALAMGILLVGIHAYLGLHVLERDVIFVDISLSQVAALGGVFSLFFFGEDGGGELAPLLISLCFCLGAAFLLAAFRRWAGSVSQEALIGMTYAFASGALILAADRLPHGGEHLKESLVGNLLFVTWGQVAGTFAVYAVVGLVHVLFRHRFWAASRQARNAFTWDFLFYLLFGVVITFSTKHAGVLVVFAILVAPAALAKRYRHTLQSRLLLAWGTGWFGLVVAFGLSSFADLPVGPTIVCTLTFFFFLSLLLPPTARSRSLPYLIKIK